MSNHLHFIWELTSMNAKKMPHASFNKATAHGIINDLKESHKSALPYFSGEGKERSFRIWQPDPLAILMDSRKKLEQKPDYIHGNPLKGKWNLVKSPEDYYWSSARFYKTEEGSLVFLLIIWKESKICG